MNPVPEAGGPAPRAPGQIALSLRIGITGHRDITAGHPGLTTEIANAVEYVVEKLAADPDRIRSGQTALTAVSSLAEGADRLVAREILKYPGSRLEIVLPLPPADYGQDFTSAASATEFEQLSHSPGATTDIMPPARSRNQAYELAGHAVADRSDVMIVVWDGRPARGVGGTADIYAYARRWQIPILLISIDDHSAALETDHVPRAAHGNSPLSGQDLKRLDQYNNGHLPLPPGPEPGTALASYIWPYLTRADLLATRFQWRWLWAARLLYTLAPLAILAVAAQVTFAPEHVSYAWFEFAILVIIIAVLVAVRRARWHQRWVSARYLAEQIRSLMFLGLTGIITLDKPAPVADHQNESGWTERAASEIWFTRPRDHHQHIEISALTKVLYEQWIRKQQEYHVQISRTYRARSTRLQLAAVGLFGLSALFALLHSLGTGGTSSRPFKWWDFLAIVIPGVAAALGGYGAQRDYVRHGERSRLFAATLDSASDRLLTAATLPDVQQAALGVSRAMRSEATDWYTVVHSQDVELPS